MTPSDPSIRTSRWKHALAVIATAALFAIAHTQSTLYFSNQHQYFVHGLASAGAGHLDRDWLANTLDPTPAFSSLVEFSARHMRKWAIHVVYGLLLGVYILSLAAIGSLFLAKEGSGRRQALFVLIASLIVAHAGIVRWGCVRWLGTDYPWYLQAGVAGQYVLGPGLQPSAFGVLLITSIVAFAYRRLFLALACCSGACIMHATYLLPAAFITSAYLFVFWRERRRRTAILFGIGTLLIVSPVVVYTLWTFAPTSPKFFAESQRILAEVRIPHHTMIGQWFDRIAAAQIAWFGIALALSRKTKLFPILGITAILSVATTLIQMATGNITLSLLFPWRVSAVLMPIATAIIFVRLAAILPPHRWIWVAGSIVIAGATVGGIIVQSGNLAYKTNEAERPALEYVRAHKQPGDLYLIPVRVPATGSGPRGSVSTSFTPPPNSSHLIAVDLQRFRLFTEAPLYVDFKSIPYKDTDVLEWYRRLRQCQEWYARQDWNSLDLREALRKEGITHVFMPANRSIDGEGYDLIYADAAFRIYRMR